MLEGLEPNKRTYHCRVNQIREELSETDRKIFDDALEDRAKWTPYSLSQALMKRGVKIQDKPIRKHREGTCTCSKT